MRRGCPRYAERFGPFLITIQHYASRLGARSASTRRYKCRILLAVPTRSCAARLLYVALGLFLKVCPLRY